MYIQMVRQDKGAYGIRPLAANVSMLVDRCFPFLLIVFAYHQGTLFACSHHRSIVFYQALLDSIFPHFKNTLQNSSKYIFYYKQITQISE